MQKRFCACGHMVLVRYLSNNGSWQPLFLVSQHPPRRHKIHVCHCPNCGAPLSINSLR